MNEDQKKLIKVVISLFEKDVEKTEELIATMVKRMLPVVYFDKNMPSDEEVHEVIKELQARLNFKMDRGAYVKEAKHLPWYFSEKKNIKGEFWDRYSIFLEKDCGFNPNIVSSLDTITDDLMDMLGNPNQEGTFQRRGLVIGDVQSGKTSTYIALMNKAVDAGYKVVILLTGTIEKLRRQTQSRVDLGLIGLDSTALSKNKDNVYIGVGEIDKRISCMAVTSTISDFNKQTANKLTGRLSGINDPVVFVLKKNKSVLEKLEQWLKVMNTYGTAGKVDSPMLLIDDEADNASVTTKQGEDPTTINKGIRKILKLFSKASYVGFTATPYANIFIDPISKTEMLLDDLFPKDFIYALEAPSNYIGADSIFNNNGEFNFMLKDNGDCEYYLPLKHKKDQELGALPDSLKMAIGSFLITNVIRDLRKHNTNHRTMMINISIYIDVQKRIAKQVDEYLRNVQRTVKNYYLLEDDALKYKEISLLKEVYDKYYSNVEFPWELIQKNLYPSIAPIVVRFVNGGNAAKNLNYDENEQDGLRIIAIGGYSLSRGLTLEGLSTSYLYRNTRMYDTLMQMGRWFGYRPKYEDLCQIWINDDAIEWYKYITEASSELKREVRRMQAANRTPKDFGLCVRSDKAALLVTARNKMLSAENYSIDIQLSGNVVETPFLDANSEIQEKNLTMTKNFIQGLINSGYKPTIGNAKYALKDHFQFLNVDKQFILDYLLTYTSNSYNTSFDTMNLYSIINNQDKYFDYWDIVIAEGEGKDYTIHENIRIKCVKRSFAIKKSISAIQMSGSKSRIGSKTYAKGGLLKEEIKELEDYERKCLVEKDKKSKYVSEKAYFRTINPTKMRNPLLVIYPVELKDNITNIQEKNMNKDNLIQNIDIPLIGLSIGLPEIIGQEPISYNYKVNIIKQRELYGLQTDDPDEIDESLEE